MRQRSHIHFEVNLGADSKSAGINGSEIWPYREHTSTLVHRAMDISIIIDIETSPTLHGDSSRWTRNGV